MRGSIEAQGITASFEETQDGYRLTLVNSGGHLLASATFAPDVPVEESDDEQAWTMPDDHQAWAAARARQRVA